MKIEEARMFCTRRAGFVSAFIILPSSFERCQGDHGRCRADYRCCLPALAGFVSPHSMGPGSQRLPETDAGFKEKRSAGWNGVHENACAKKDVTLSSVNPSSDTGWKQHGRQKNKWKPFGRRCNHSVTSAGNRRLQRVPGAGFRARHLWIRQGSRVRRRKELSQALC